MHFLFESDNSKMGCKSIAIIFAGVALLFEVVICSEIATTSNYSFANYGEPCLRITDCDSAAYLTCINSSCQCALSSSMVFDDASSSCWVLPGEKCIYKAPELGVIASLESDERTLRDRLSFRCVSNADCEDGVCVCGAGYFATGNGTCEKQREQGEHCTAEHECRSSVHLICNTEGNCGCNMTTSVFDEEHGICVGTAGSSCFDFELCTENAYCPSFGIINQFDVKCTCKSGYFETANRTCSERQGFGTNCKSNQECREDFGLMCDTDGKCNCNMTTHVFDSVEEKCLSLIGSACQESQNCVSNADCQHSGFLNGNVLARNRICKCGYGYFENENRTCERKHDFDGICTEDNHCRDDFKLVCDKKTGQCSCNESTHTYDRSRKRCSSLAGTTCERNEHCVINSVCRSPGYLYPRQWPRAECVCKDGFHKSADGFCLGKYGGKCETWTNSCKSDLVCRHSECLCPYGKERSYYDYSSETCITYLNAPCDNITNCLVNAHCAPDKNKIPVCQCNPGMVPLDGENRCVALVGKKCSQGEDSYIPCVPNGECQAGYCRCKGDYFTVNGTCERKMEYGEMCKSHENCEDSYCDISGTCKCNTTTSIYDPERKACVRLAGAKCHDIRECVPNAVCRTPGRFSQVEVDPRCTCKEGYYQSSNGTCDYKKSYFESCSESEQCQDAADLICSPHGRCECNSTTATYDDSRKTCLRLAGATCSSHQHCVSHAKCKNPVYWIHFDSFSPHARCECDGDLGYTNSTEGRCIIDYYGGNCDSSLANSCSLKYQCIDGKCLCPYEDHQVYDFKTKACQGLAKGPCDNGTNVCVKNAHCITTEEGVSECRCKHGFIGVDRGCELTFGQACSHRTNLDEPFCDRLAPLKCVTGTCQCGGFQYYDYEFKKCRGLLGSRCDPEDKEFCTEGAFCEVYRGMAKKRYGRCRCVQGYFAEDNRSCTRIIVE